MRGKFRVTAANGQPAAIPRALFVAENACAVRQQHLAIQQHLAAWRLQHKERKQQLEQERKDFVVVGLSGQLVIYPSYVLLPPGAQGIFLLTLRASHPKVLDTFILVSLTCCVRVEAVVKVSYPTSMQCRLVSFCRLRRWKTANLLPFLLKLKFHCHICALALTL